MDAKIFRAKVRQNLINCPICGAKPRICEDIQDHYVRCTEDMQGIEWGLLYNQYHTNKYDPKELEERVSRLM